MNRQEFDVLDFNIIKEKLIEYANSPKAKEKIRELKPYLSETELIRQMRETTQARKMLDLMGLPPLPAMEQIEVIMNKVERYELLAPEEVEEAGIFLTSVKRMKEYLEKGQVHQMSIAYYSENLTPLEELRAEIARCIRGGRIDDYASAMLKELRRSVQMAREKIKEKAESLLKSQKSYMNENFIVERSGRICLPVKKDFRRKIEGSVIDKSSTGTTLFVEPKAVTKLREEYEQRKIDEDNEERRILYTLMSQIEDVAETINKDIEALTKLDFMFAKGKLSAQMEAVEPAIGTQGGMKIKAARHPLLPRESCVPLDFELRQEEQGVIITGPNTGGKTVAIKTVGLFCLMAGSGLHLPCERADIRMVNQVLCDIGDGQSMQDNLSTFSSHITNVLDILKRVTKESLVILDELGSGTDPAEGMGIAVAILEQLRKSGCLFLVTTHYPEVKTYAARHGEIVNARMGFDRENLRPLYKMEIGRAGDSCALYIAKRLGMPENMLFQAAKEAYGELKEELMGELGLSGKSEIQAGGIEKIFVPGIEKKPVIAAAKHVERYFGRGDSVTIYPEEVIGIVVEPADLKGNVLVQVKKEKRLINYKRLKLKVAATSLYPENYDFSIIFDTVETRKARHHMQKHHMPDVTIYSETK